MATNSGLAIANPAVGLAKLNRPWLPAVLPRERLFQRLDSVQSQPCTWIGAPGGYGKTTLAASYVEMRSLPCLWYQLDEDDADLATFFYYLGLAADSLGDGPPLPLLTPESQQDIPAFTRRYIRLLCQRLNPPFILLLDNYHRLPAEATFHGMLAEALNDLPSGVRCLVTSRGEPPLALSRARLHGQLAIISMEALRLTLPEAQGIADLEPDHRPTIEDVQRLHEQVQGWAAGLTLLLRDAQIPFISRPLPASALLFDYFATEVFKHTDQPTQQFLLKTAFFPKMTVAMASQMIDSGDAAERLNTLVRSHYFTFRNDTAEASYQYHDLFRDFLLRRGIQTFDATDYTHYQRRAAVILEAVGDLSAAVELRQALGDWEELSGLVQQQAQCLLQQGRSQLLEAWLNSFPTTVREQSPWLLYWLGLCELHRTPVAARKTLVRAYRHFKHAGNSAGLWLAWAAITDTYCRSWDHIESAAGWLTEFERQHQRYPHFPSAEIEARVICGMFNILVRVGLDHPQYTLWEQRLVRTVESDCTPDIYLVSLMDLLFQYIWVIGRRAKVVWALRHLQAATAVGSVNLFMRSLIQWGEFCYRYWYEGDLAGCLALAEQMSAIVAESGTHFAIEPSRASFIYYHLTLGQLEAGRAALQHLEAALKFLHPLERLHYDVLRTWEAWLSGRFLEALEILERGLPESRKSMLHANGTMYWLLAQVHGSMGHRAATLRYLAGMRFWTRTASSQVGLFVRTLLVAQFALQWKQHNRGLRLLRAAFTIGRREGYLCFPFFKSEDLSRLCMIALDAGIEVEYAQTLIQKRGLLPDSTVPTSERWPWPVKLYTLGRFALVIDEQPLTFGRKAQHKPLQLLKILLSWGGRDVEQARIADALWPDADGDTAQQTLTTTLHRLRRLLGHDEAVYLRDGRLSLDSRYCWVDLWCLERRINQAHEHIRERKTTAAAADMAALAHNLLGAYRGSFLGQDNETWALQARQRLQNRYLKIMEEIGAHLEDQQDWNGARACYQRGMELAPASERCRQGLRRCNPSLESC
ncbi:MAG: hypothetical protein ABTQ93_07090 [Candidatus Competibacter denitrificans]